MADTTNRLAGTAYLTVDGKSYPLIKFSYDPGKVTRESQSGMDGVHGYKEKPRPPSIKASIRDAFGQKVADFNAMTSVTVVGELANGKLIVGRNMWTVEAQEVDTDEASFDISFEGLQGAVTEQ